MNQTERGIIININAYGATVRLLDGRLASVPFSDLQEHRPAYERALTGRKVLQFLVRGDRRHAMALIVPQLRDDEFEEQIAGYLKMTEEWENPEGPRAHERHFLRKKKRAALFESKHSAKQ